MTEVRPLIAKAFNLRTSAGIVPVAFVGLVLGGEIRSVFIALAVSLPGLLLQDSCRYAFLALGRPRSAFVNDAVWGSVLVGAIFVGSAAEAPSAGQYTLVWGLTGSLAGVLGMWQLGFLPNFRSIPTWLKSNRDIAPRFFLEYLAATGGFYGAFLAVGTVAGLVGVGALYAARVVMAPIGVLDLAASSYAVSEGSRHQHEPAGVSRFVGKVGSALAVAALLWTVVLLAVPSSVGRGLLGESWVEARPVLLSFGIFWATRGAIVGARSGLRIFAAAVRSLRSESIASMLIFIGSVIGATLAGAAGASLGLAITGCVGAAVWWFELRQETTIVIASDPKQSGNEP